MKIIFHEKFYYSGYSADPAAGEGRLDGIMDIINEKTDMYEIIKPEPAVDEDILRAHTHVHLDRIRSDYHLSHMAFLAAGGSILAAHEGYLGNPAFAVIRPPGHHASADSCWGFCYFNNISISLLKLYAEGRIKTAFVFDFDLHTGDGNINIFEGRGDGLKVKILNPMAGDRTEYINEVDRYMASLKDIDIFVASAGFDQGVDDWGGLLHPEDYTELGRLMREYSEKLCEGRRYALLEGGYNHDVIGTNVDAFCEGFQ